MVSRNGNLRPHVSLRPLEMLCTGAEAGAGLHALHRHHPTVVLLSPQDPASSRQPEHRPGLRPFMSCPGSASRGDQDP